MEKTGSTKDLRKKSENKNRLRDDSESDSGLEYDAQNQPPRETSTYKWYSKGDITTGASSQNTLKSPEESKGSFVTPAACVIDGTPQVAPGAPRILLINQQVNSDIQRQPNPDRPGASHYLQLLRTPPAKSGRLYLRKDECEVYRGFDRFERVSDEIILKIFHYLPRHMMNTCALVCRRWSRIVGDKSLWRQMNLGGRLLKEGVLKILLERGVEVLRLNRSEVLGDFGSTVHGSPDPCMSPLSEDRMYRLRLLDMSMANVKTSLVESMLKFCPKLRRISLENIPVTENLLLNLGFGSPCLQTLNLCMCEGVTFKGLEYVIKNCTSLCHLNIAWTCMPQSDLNSLIKILPQQLQCLDISGNREKITDEDVTTICDRCPHLQDLDLSDTTEITNFAVDEIGTKLNHLQKVSLSRCYNISPTALVNLVNLPHLETVNVFGMMRNTSLIALEQYLARFVVNKEPFSTIARPSPYNSQKGFIWNVSIKDKSSL